MVNTSCVRCSGGPRRFCACAEYCGFIECGGVKSAQMHPPIHFVQHPNGYSVQCFADNPNALTGVLVAQLETGDDFFNLARIVEEHTEEHGCKTTH